MQSAANGRARRGQHPGPCAPPPRLIGWACARWAGWGGRGGRGRCTGAADKECASCARPRRSGRERRPGARGGGTVGPGPGAQGLTAACAGRESPGVRETGQLSGRRGVLDSAAEPRVPARVMGTRARQRAPRARILPGSDTTSRDTPRAASRGVSGSERARGGGERAGKGAVGRPSGARTCPRAAGPREPRKGAERGRFLDGPRAGRRSGGTGGLGTGRAGSSGRAPGSSGRGEPGGGGGGGRGAEEEPGPTRSTSPPPPPPESP